MAEDGESGVLVARLAYRHPKDPLANLEVRVAVSAGANLFSFRVGEDELMYGPEQLADIKDQKGGTPVMFPTPNRVRDGRMVFEKRTFTFDLNSGTNFIHGLARRRPFSAGRTSATASSASVDTVLEWDDQQPEFERFPIRHRLTVTFTLRRERLRIGYKVQNRDKARLPFGFGVHPYFRIPGAREDVVIKAPLAQRMEAEGYLPTGKLLPVAGTAHDLRQGAALPGLALDDVYLGMTPRKAASFQLRDRGLEVALSGSADFTHLVVYTPPERGFFCIENQTSSTDAHNLHARGLRKVANLQVVAPGKRAAGHTEWVVKRIASTALVTASRPRS